MRRFTITLDENFLSMLVIIIDQHKNLLNSQDIFPYVLRGISKNGYQLHSGLMGIVAQVIGYDLNLCPLQEGDGFSICNSLLVLKGMLAEEGIEMPVVEEITE